MESIEKLRGMRGNMATYEDLIHECCIVADEIEREIAELYMPLPVDADGVPIHVGDDMANEEIGPLRVLGVFSTGFIWVDDAGECFEASLLGRSKYHHVKPDPVKELLEEFANKIPFVWDGDKPKEAWPYDSLMDEYAARIREAVEK